MSRAAQLSPLLWICLHTLAIRNGYDSVDLELEQYELYSGSP